MSWIDVGDVKPELSKSSSSTIDDDALQAKIDAACDEIEDRVGHVDQVSYTVTVTVGWDGQAQLDETPVLAVSSVQLLNADGTLNTDFGAGTDPDPSGSLYGLPRGIVQIAYTAGRDPVPANYVEAAVQLAAHLWRVSRALTENGRLRSEAPLGPGMSSSMPNRVKDLLGLTGKAGRSAVFVG